MALLRWWVVSPYSGTKALAELIYLTVKVLIRHGALTRQASGYGALGEPQSLSVDRCPL